MNAACRERIYFSSSVAHYYEL